MPLRNQQKSLFAPRVLSGVQPSGALHLGNFYGAIEQHIALQHEYPGESFYFIANYHALTTIHDANELVKQSWNVALDYLALGLDPTKSTFYRQTDVPQVCELMWILSCVTGKGLLDRGHAYKEKIDKGLVPSVGLFLYPELMAADILAVRSTIVPVGNDQVQHLEITRDIANSFNYTFGRDVFPSPEAKLNAAATVPGIDGQKMSKSYENTIPIFANDEDLKAKVMHIKTSSVSLATPLIPDGDTVFTLYSLVSTPQQRVEMRERYLSGDIGYRQAKVELLANLITYFEPFRERRQDLANDLDQVEDILRDGALRARQEIAETLETVREAIGISHYHRHLTTMVN
jgi:tryptophanyl-tRNA synthetase